MVLIKSFSRIPLETNSRTTGLIKSGSRKFEVPIVGTWNFRHHNVLPPGRGTQYIEVVGTCNFRLLDVLCPTYVEASFVLNSDVQ